MSEQELTARLEKGRTQLRDLESRRARADADLDNAKREENRLRQQAEQEFGTSDLDQLRAKYREMEQANEVAVQEFEQQLAEISTKLQEIAAGGTA